MQKDLFEIIEEQIPKMSKSHKRIEFVGSPKKETSPGVINTADNAKQRFAIAVMIKAVGKNFLTSEPSARTPFTNLPMP